MNFYLQLEPGELSPEFNHLKEFRNDYPHLHIGKSSCGWCFTMHIIPELDINTWDDWQEYIMNHGIRICDEDDGDITMEELKDRVENRSHDRPIGKPDDIFEKPAIAEKFDLYRGITTWGDFYRQNSAEPGPNNLLRHKIESGICVAHGEGTWDYCEGSFS